MKPLFALFFAMFFTSLSYAQLDNPVTWTFEAQKVNESEYDLLFKAEVQSGWYIYSQFLKSDDGPVSTSINLNFADGFMPVDLPEEEGTKKEGFDEIFQMEITKYSGLTTFKQRIRVTKPLDKIEGFVEYMTCNNERCLPPTDAKFSIPLK